MTVVKPCSSPITLHTPSDVGSPCSDEDAQNYRAMVGALHYITFNRLDIAFSIGKLSQHMHSPCDSHLVAVKRVLRYLVGTVSFGILFKIASGDQFTLTTILNCDWAGDPLDRRSTSGFAIFMGANPIFWAAKKQKPQFFEVLLRLV